MTKVYDNSLKGACQWACEAAGLNPDKLQPDHVIVYLKDGSAFSLGSLRQPDFSGADVISLHIKHPDSKEIITVDIGPRH
jgi:hypothetical protein